MSAMVMKGSILLLAMLAATAGQAAAQSRSGPLLATDLYAEQRGPNRRALMTIDPALSTEPAIVRSLHAANIGRLGFEDEECGSLGCYRNISIARAFSGARLIAVFITTDQYLGGAHGAVVVGSRLFDRRTGRELRFADLFTSWADAQPILQDKVCSALRQARPDGGMQDCPPVAELAIAPSDDVELPIDAIGRSFEVRTSDYQLGSYAAGRDNVQIALDDRLLALIRPEYRADFSVRRSE